MRLLLFALLLTVLLGSRAAQAQAPVRPAAALLPNSAASVAPGSATDTAAALHRYFAQRRHNGRVALGVGASFLAGSGIALVVAGNSKGYDALAPAALAVLGVLFGGPALARGIVLTATHSPKREQRIVQAWQRHRLPMHLARRALVPEYTLGGR